jgi:hypothetical protein
VVLLLERVMEGSMYIKAPFKVGDIVVLKSHSLCWMTVVHVLGASVTVEWLDNYNNPMTRDYPIDAVVKIEPEKQIPPEDTL